MPPLAALFQKAKTQPEQNVQKLNTPTGKVIIEVHYFDENDSLYKVEQVHTTKAALTSWEKLSLKITPPVRGSVAFSVFSESRFGETFLDDLCFTPQEVARVVQENHYYPFGMNLKGVEREPVGYHRWQYNGKEKTFELGLHWTDYQARNLDVQLGRWHSVDPAAELMRRHSVYNYAFDNPIRFIDPDGMMPWIPDGNGSYIAEDGDSAWTLAEQAGLSFERAKEIMSSQGMGVYIDSEDGVEKSDVDPGDLVTVPEQAEASEQEWVDAIENTELEKKITEVEEEQSKTISIKIKLSRQLDSMEDAYYDFMNNPENKSEPTGNEPKGGKDAYRTLKGWLMEIKEGNKKEQIDSAKGVIEKQQETLDSLKDKRK